MTFFGLLVNVLVAVGVTAVIELTAGARAWVPIASRAAALLAGYAVLVVLLLPLNSSVVLPVVEPIDGMPAAAAGIEKGDRVRAVNGVPVATFGEVATQVSSSGNDVTLAVERAGAVREVVVRRTPEGAIGVRPTGEKHSQTAGEILAKPLAAFAMSVRVLQATMKPQPLVVGGPVMLYSGGAPSSVAASLAIALGLGATLTLPVVAAALLASLWFRPRLLQRNAR